MTRPMGHAQTIGVISASELDIMGEAAFPRFSNNFGRECAQMTGPMIFSENNMYPQSLPYMLFRVTSAEDVQKLPYKLSKTILNKTVVEMEPT